MAHRSEKFLVSDFAGAGRIRFVEDPGLAGQRTARMQKDGDEIHVSPAMYELLKTDFDAMTRTLIVEVNPSARQR